MQLFASQNKDVGLLVAYGEPKTIGVRNYWG